MIGARMHNTGIFERTVYFIGFVFFLFFITSSALSQKKTAPPTKTFVPDTVDVQKMDASPVKSIIQDTSAVSKEKTAGQAKVGMPKLELQEYTIFGTEKLYALPAQRKAIEMADYTESEQIKFFVERGEYFTPVYGGQKLRQPSALSAGSILNEVYSSLGRYTDFNAGAKVYKKFSANDIFAIIDIHRNSGHVKNADYYTVTGKITDNYQIWNSVQSTADMQFDLHSYRFYGADPPYQTKRQGNYWAVSSSNTISRFESVAMQADFGGNYYNPDASKYFNWDLWTKFNINSVYKSTLFNSTINLQTDRIKDGARDNAPISDANYHSILITGERLVKPNLLIRFGSTLYNTYSKNASSSYSIKNNALIPSNRDVRIRDNTKFYPQLWITYDMQTRGKLFFEFEPSVKPFTLYEKLQEVPYLDLRSPLAFENNSQSIKIGWRRSILYNVAFELYYCDRRIKNYSFLIENKLSISPVQDGMWTYSFDNTIDVSEYHIAVNWNPHTRFTLYSSLGFSDITVHKSAFADRVPYLPKIIFDSQAIYFPGKGYQVIGDSKYIGMRYVTPIASASGKQKLSDYLLLNVTVTKRWTSQIGGYAFVSNLFNERYQIWNRYSAPGFIGGIGVRYFW